MAENQEPAETYGPPDPLVLTPLTRRSHPPEERPPLPPNIEEQLNHLRESVQILSAHFLGEVEPPMESLKDRSARRIKKFHRASGDERTASLIPGDDPTREPSPEGIENVGSDDEAAERLERNKHIAWPRLTDATQPNASRSGAFRWWQGRPTLGVLLGAQVLGFLLLVVGYLVGRTTSARGQGPGRTAPDLFGQPELAEQAMQTADAGLQAEHAGDPDKARKVYETAVNKHVPLAGMNYRLAVLAVQRNDRLEAEQRLERTMQNGENVAESCYVLARLAADKGDYEDASDDFQRATQAQPFTGKYFFYLGEMLRREGKPLAAVVAFEQALARPYTAESGDLYLFKQRLAKVEFGHDDVFNAELAARLKEASIAGEWLLLAAAQELDHQAYTAAAEHLRLASDHLPSVLYATLTRDYAFQTYAKRSEVAALLGRIPNTEVSSAGPTVLDPGSWPPQRGDPALWASATK